MEETPLILLRYDILSDKNEGGGRLGLIRTWTKY